MDCSKLIQTKTEFIEKIYKRYDFFLPPYFKLNELIFKRCKIPIWIQFFILIPPAALLNWFIDNVTGASALFKDFWLYFTFGMLIILHAFLSIWYIWNKHLDAFKDILELLNSEHQISEIEIVFKIMYTSKYQFVIIVFFFFLAILVVAPLYPQINSLLRVYTVLFISFSAAVAGIGMWLAATSCYFIYKISTFTDLNVNIFFPGQDATIFKISRLFSSYSTLFAIEVLLWIIPYTIFMTTSKSRGIAFNMTSPYHLYGSIFLFLIFLVFMPGYFLYPQTVLKKIVRERRIQTLLSIQRVLDKLYQVLDQNKQTFDIEKQILKYTKLLQSVSSAPNLKIGSTTVLRSVLPFIISIFLTIAGNPIISIAIKNLLKWIYKNIISIG